MAQGGLGAGLAVDHLDFLLQLAFSPERGALHDFNESSRTVVGEGDEVFRPLDSESSRRAKAQDVRRAFPPTPQGVVQAALYELHRGEARPFAETLGDPTLDKLRRGPAAPTEGKARQNDDAATPSISRNQEEQGFGLRGTFATEMRIREVREKHRAALDRLAELHTQISDFEEGRKKHRDVLPDVLAKYTGNKKELAVIARQLAAHPEVKALFATEKQAVSQSVGHVETPGDRAHHHPVEAVGSIRASLMVGYGYAGQGRKQAPWCASFAAYVYARCGINVGAGFSAAFRAPRALAALSGAEAFHRAAVDAAHGEKQEPSKDKPHTFYYASHALSRVKSYDGAPRKPQEIPLHLEPIDLGGRGAAGIDIRPGDAAWMMHNPGEGHVMVVIGVHHEIDSVFVVTVEGNADNQVQSRSHRLQWKGGKLTGDLVGWGRPPELASFGPTADTQDAAMLRQIEVYKAQLAKGQAPQGNDR
jgi:hypothetical protein